MNKQAQPDKDGWWSWFEGGRSEPKKLLLVADGSMVAEDDEWEAVTGEAHEKDGLEYNYWSGTDTTQAMMPGRWQFIEAALIPLP